jgi:RHS repeat-associated protein
VSGPGPVTFADPGQPATTATFVDPGTYVLRLTVDDSQLAASDDVTIVAQVPAGPLPTVAISSPGDGAVITTPTDVVGSVSGGVWKLEHRLDADESSPNSWVVFASGTAPVSNARLATFDPTLLLNGTYAVRLTATTAAGSASASISLVVTGNQKIGNFTLSFIDLDIPVANLPIQIIRTYDSRDKRKGDFGVGWTLSIKDVRLEKSAVLGAHWEEIRGGGFLPTYCLRTTRPTTVTITFPTGKVYKFEATTSPTCQQLVPIDAVTLGFRPAAGTQGSLVALDEVDALVYLTDGVSPGPAELVSYDTLAPINPVLFRLTIEDGTQYVIHHRTGVQSIREPNGDTLTFTAAGILHSRGKSVSFVRDGQGRITRITDPNGNVRTYSYDAAGGIVDAGQVAGNATSFSYNGSHGLLSIVDPRGIAPARNEYDAAGRLVRHTDASGKTVNYTHDVDNRQEIITDRLGHQTVYEYDNRGNLLRVTDPLGNVRTKTYDAQDNPLTEVDGLGNVTRFTYDAVGNLLSKTDSLGNVTRYTYDSQGHLLTTTDPLGRVVRHAYDVFGNRTSTTDAAGSVWRTTYDSSGRPLQEVDPLGNVTQHAHDAAGHRIATTDPLGVTTRNTYDSNGNLLTREVTRTTPSGPEVLRTQHVYDRLDRLVKTIHPDGSVEETIYNSIGKAILNIDPLGRRTAHDYDAIGQLVRTTHPDQTTELWTYDAEGRKASFTDRDGEVTSYRYDALGRLVEVEHPDGTKNTRTLDAAGHAIAETDERGNRTLFELDALGRTLRTTDALGHVTSSTYDANGNRTSETGPDGETTRYEYDVNNRQVREIGPEGGVTAKTYDALGRVTAETDAIGLTTQFEYDAAGRLTRVQDALGGTTRFTYDEVGKPAFRVDANGHVTTFEHDAMGRLIRRTLPLGMSETWAYDAAGNLIRKTDFKGHASTLAYDVMNQVTTEEPDPGLGQPAIRFTYTPGGWRASMADGSGVTTYAYDRRGRRISKGRPEGTLTYTRDAVGNVTSIRSSNPNGTAVDYAYDALNRLIRVTDHNLSPGETSYEYDPAGHLAAQRNPNGVQSAFSYDRSDRLTRIDISRSALLASYVYTYDPAGRRLSAGESGGRTVTYGYDALHRLVRETITAGGSPSAEGSLEYSYDPAANRLSRGSTVPALPPAIHAYDANDRLVGETYDANGNTLTSGGKSFLYDGDNRLTAVGDEVLFAYDGDGNLVARTEAGVTTRYLVDDLQPTGLSQILEEVVDGTVRRLYTYGHAILSQRQRLDGGWAVSFYGRDAGSVRFLTDANGSVTDSYDYDAFGNLLRSSGTTPNERLYLGERFDLHAGLLYLRARHLNPGTGRFLTLDPAPGKQRDPLSFHPYLYAHADPVNRFDPTGEMTTVADQSMVVAMLTMLTMLWIMALSNSRVKSLSLPRWPDCSTKHPYEERCYWLPRDYIFTSAPLALAIMKGELYNRTLSLHGPTVTTGGPCPGEGTHYNVRFRGERMGSITCCPCCEDVVLPVMKTKCRIVW